MKWSFSRRRRSPAAAAARPAPPPPQTPGAAVWEYRREGREVWKSCDGNHVHAADNARNADIDHLDMRIKGPLPDPARCVAAGAQPQHRPEVRVPSADRRGHKIDEL